MSLKTLNQFSIQNKSKFKNINASIAPQAGPFFGKKLSGNIGIGRGVFGGGDTTVPVNTIDFVTIASAGNATDFGDLTQARYLLAGCSSATRGLFSGGFTGVNANTIDFVTIASAGNATDFGDVTQDRSNVTGCSSATRGLFGGGVTSVAVNTIDFVTIASAGNATDFGDLSQSRYASAGCSSATRGLFGGGDTSNGQNNAPVNTIDFVTIASAGNATDFGDLTQARREVTGCSSATRGLFSGGLTHVAPLTVVVDTIDFVTIASAGNATDFGDLTQARAGVAGCSSATRGLFGGGLTSVKVDTIDFVTIASAGNATDFGDLTQARNRAAGFSDVHGGL